MPLCTTIALKLGHAGIVDLQSNLSIPDTKTCNKTTNIIRKTKRDGGTIIELKRWIYREGATEIEVQR